MLGLLLLLRKGGFSGALAAPRQVRYALPLAVLSLANFLGGWPQFPGLSLFCTLVSAAVCEEIIFRGLLRRDLGHLPHPLLACSILFGLMHLLSLSAPMGLLLCQAVSAGCLGYLYGQLTEITGSLLPAMLSHCLLNATAAGVGESAAGYLVIALLAVLYSLSLKSVKKVGSVFARSA